jgi:hypothetical protein
LRLCDAFKASKRDEREKGLKENEKVLKATSMQHVWMLELLGDESQTENNFEPFSSAALSSY